MHTGVCIASHFQIVPIEPVAFYHALLRMPELLCMCTDDSVTRCVVIFSCTDITLYLA